MNDKSTSGAMCSAEDTTTDDFGHLHHPDGSITVAEQPRRDSRRMKYALETPQERNLVQDYCNAEMTVRTIADCYGVSFASVPRLAQLYGVPQRSPALSRAKTKINANRAVALRKSGLSNRDIARVLDEKQGTVANLLARRPDARLTNEERLERQRKGKAAQLARRKSSQ